ncbi:hypothetical protein O181_068980 [Austropuccinia psidii MF-1]|uniref:Integrase catalytic domain-containing protein n=1 Tax=Austropuccinia psidii MF-1 TaxID=1389203 RepID=A0A9Q3F219_9BASI|nr:hypothetical protein [Austropuccinia psidii MF-1]
MDWATCLPPGGDKSYNACLVIVDRFSKTPIFLPCHKDDAAMETALLIWNIAIFTNLHKLFGANLSFSTALYPKTNGLAERMIQSLEDMVRIFWEFG